MKYMVNGWEEGRGYFMSLGCFTRDEIQSMMDGDTVTKGSNEFRIVIED